MAEPACRAAATLSGWGVYPIDENRPSPETEADEAMEGASDIQTSAFPGNFLPRQCGIATFTSDVPSAGRREFLRARTRSRSRSKANGKAGD